MTTIILDPDTYERMRGALSWLQKDWPGNYVCQEKISNRIPARPPAGTRKTPYPEIPASPARDNIRYGGAVNIWRKASGGMVESCGKNVARRPHHDDAVTCGENSVEKHLFRRALEPAGSSAITPAIPVINSQTTTEDSKNESEDQQGREAAADQ